MGLMREREVDYRSAFCTPWWPLDYYPCLSLEVHGTLGSGQVKKGLEKGEKKQEVLLLLVILSF